MSIYNNYKHDRFIQRITIVDILINIPILSLIKISGKMTLENEPWPSTQNVFVLRHIFIIVELVVTILKLSVNSNLSE